MPFDLKLFPLKLFYVLDPAWKKNTSGLFISGIWPRNGICWKTGGCGIRETPRAGVPKNDCELESPPTSYTEPNTYKAVINGACLTTYSRVTSSAFNWDLNSFKDKRFSLPLITAFIVLNSGRRPLKATTVISTTVISSSGTTTFIVAS